MTVLTQEGHAEDFNSRELEEEKLQRHVNGGRQQGVRLAEGEDPLVEPGRTPLEGPLMRGGSKEGVPCHHHSGTQKGTPPELPTDTQRP